MVIKTANISNIAITIFGIDIYWYAILIVIAILIGILWSKINDERFGIKFSDILDLIVFLIPISFICARLYYCIFSFDTFKNNLIEIFNIRNGGLAIYGGIIGAVLTIMVFCKIKKIIFLN